MGHSNTEKGLILNVINFDFPYIYHISAHEWVLLSPLCITIPTCFDGFWVTIRHRTCVSFSGTDYVDTLIRPVVTYGAEALTLTKKEEQALLIFERKIFRRIYGPKYENGEWKSPTNRELEEMSKGEKIVK